MVASFPLNIPDLFPAISVSILMNKMSMPEEMKGPKKDRRRPYQDLSLWTDVDFVQNEREKKIDQKARI